MAEFEPEREESASLEDYLRVLREKFWVVIIAVVVVAAAAVAVSITTTPLYKASTTLVYQRTGLDTALLGTQFYVYDSNQARAIDTALAVIDQNQSIAQAVKDELTSDRSTGSLLGMITVSADPNNNVVRISAVSDDPAEAAAVANAFSREFVAYRQQTDRATIATARDVVKQQLDTLSPTELQGEYGLMLQDKYETLRILESMQNGGFAPVSAAVPPRAAFTPQTTRNTILGLVVGLVLGVGLAFLLDYLDKRIKDEKTFEREFGTAVLVTVPSVGGGWGEGKKTKGRSTHPVGFNQHKSLIEPFRTLRSSLQYFSLGKQNSVWLITSGLPKEGKTITSVNLALSFALSGKRVVIVETDLRRPMVHEYLGIDSEVGLTDVLAGTRKMAEVLQLIRADDFLPEAGRRTPGEENPKLLQRNLYAIAAGPLPPNPAELLASERMGTLIQELKGITDVIIIDTPPVLMVSDALALLPHVDGVLLAARLHSTTHSEAQGVRSVLERAQARVVGVVAGGAKHGPGYYNRRGYGSYSGGNSGYGYTYGGYSSPSD